VVGNDGALSAAMLEDLCDGVVSGVASALPELMHALYTALDSDPHSEESRAHSATLNSLLPWLDKFPVPWGLKIVAAERSLCPADFPFPQSPGRLSEARAFLHWLRDNRSALLMNDLPGANSARSLSAARQR
jgi:4-hydroxy-tetrahydrodipicolinate synthase